MTVQALIWTAAAVAAIVALMTVIEMAYEAWYRWRHGMPPLFFDEDADE